LPGPSDGPGAGVIVAGAVAVRDIRPYVHRGVGEAAAPAVAVPVVIGDAASWPVVAARFFAAVVPGDAVAAGVAVRIRARVLRRSAVAARPRVTVAVPEAVGAAVAISVIEGARVAVAVRVAVAAMRAIAIAAVVSTRLAVARVAVLAAVISVAVAARALLVDPVPVGGRVFAVGLISLRASVPRSSG
jgi:hypothetical protein